MLELKDLDESDPLFAKYMQLAPGWPSPMNGESVEVSKGHMAKGSSPLTDSIDDATLEFAFPDAIYTVITATTRIILPYRVHGKMHFADISDVLSESKIVSEGRLQMILDPVKVKQTYEALFEKYGITAFSSPSFAIQCTETHGKSFGFTALSYEQPTGLQNQTEMAVTSTNFWVKQSKQVKQLGDDQGAFNEAILKS